jgi:acyl-[acyl-carrier-protein]-phospholipid O-acyltransferase/long-chain-fatty-acid--[acyl-carrier-protein] ligase
MNRSFVSFLGTQALGAFNDNVFKQLVLLLCLGQVAFGLEFQAIVQLLFALPFLIFSGFAGDLSDRFSKGRLMVACKIGEVVVMLAALIVFLTSSRDSAPGEIPAMLWMLAVVTFLMGTQSAFFGPPKYGGLPDLVRGDQLPVATGLTQMTTFFAIILGVAVSGLLADSFADHLYVPGIAVVAIAIAGTLTSLGIAQHPASPRGQRLSARSFLSMFPTLRQAAREDRLLFLVMLLYSFFWLVGGVSLPAINLLGRLQLGMTNFETSLLVSSLSVGIGLGSLLVGKLSRGEVRLSLATPGLGAMVVLLGAAYFLPVHSPTADEMRRFAEAQSQLADTGSIIPAATPVVKALTFTLTFLLGIAAGFLSVPLLAFVQERPESARKGKVFAAVNWLNWVFIVGSAIFYGVGVRWSESRAHVLFAWLGGLSLVVGMILIPSIRRLAAR